MPEFLRTPLGRAALCLVLAFSAAAVAQTGGTAQPAVADPALEKRVLAVSVELRCLVCQNQTIADSNADLAVDLRNQVREMLRQGKDEPEILAYMTARYGDFVLYRPPVKNTTALLWFGPPVLLGAGLLTLWLILRRRSRLAGTDFEPDEEDMAAAEAAQRQDAR